MTSMTTGDEGRLVPLAEIRERVRELETGLRRLKGSGAKAVALLELRSRLEGEVSAHEAKGVDLRAERGRLNSIDDILKREAATLVRQAAAGGGLAAARQRLNPPESEWWWWLDRQVSEGRRKQLTKLGIMVGGAIVVIAVILGLNALLTRRSGDDALAYVSAGEQALRNRDYDRALTEYERAVTVDPKASEAQIALGVLYEMKGRTADANKALAAARELLGNELDYLLALARAYQTAGQLDQALAQAEAALALDPNSAQAYLTRAGIHEDLGNRVQALQDLERTATLALENDQAELAAVAKMRLGMLSQQVPADMFGTGEPPEDAETP
ncbi:MAG: tetratricopeptide repeat protein [Chloroflexi bacterium]|nr:tetratricopeptide repeat protein [Chloroflexota bacterium]